MILRTKDSGQGWIRTTELRRGQIYSLLPLATWLLTLALYLRADGGIRTPDPLITNQLLWPTELHRHKTRLFTRTYLPKTDKILFLGVQIYD